eukprot:11270833-Alexandrium_andersonii.AAC.1
MTDCRLGRIAAPTGLGRIAECTLGTLQCKGARYRSTWCGWLDCGPPDHGVADRPGCTFPREVAGAGGGLKLPR